jgi:DNA-binding transcriptional ArsR family regulator
VLAALGEPIRLGVVDLLQTQDLSPDALARALHVPGNLLAHHLKVLESAGVVTRAHSQNDRRRTYVQLVAGALEGLLPQPEPLTAPRVVFVCTHNSARSVLAEAVWHTLSDVPSASAGTHPACDSVNEELGDLTHPHFHWSIPDPAHTDTDEAFTAALAQINERVTQLAPRIRSPRPTGRSNR